MKLTIDEKLVLVNMYNEKLKHSKDVSETELLKTKLNEFLDDLSKDISSSIDDLLSESLFIVNAMDNNNSKEGIYKLKSIFEQIMEYKNISLNQNMLIIDKNTLLDMLNDVQQKTIEVIKESSKLIPMQNMEYKSENKNSTNLENDNILKGNSDNFVEENNVDDYSDTKKQNKNKVLETIRNNTLNIKEKLGMSKKEIKDTDKSKHVVIYKNSENDTSLNKDDTNEGINHHLNTIQNKIISKIKHNNISSARKLINNLDKPLRKVILNSKYKGKPLMEWVRG